jgi:membrane protein YdbS with pleckstrin-like domain
MSSEETVTTESSPSERTADGATVGGQTTHRAETEGIDLLPDEQVLVNVHPGWSVWSGTLVGAVLVGLLGLGTLSSSVGTGLFFLVLAAAIAGYVYLSRSRSRYIVTDERIKAKVGILSKTTREYRIADIQSITTEQSLFERLLSLGNIQIRTAANDGLVWKGVPEHSTVGNQIRKMQREYE